MTKPNERQPRDKLFFEDLEEFDDFELISDLSRYKPVPDDRSVIIP